MGFPVRRAVAGDATRILGLLDRAGLTISTVEFDWRRYAVAESGNGEIIGCAQLKPHIGYVELASVAVDEPYRGQRVARAVIEYLLAQQSRPVFLVCSSGLGSFYEKFGFRSVGWAKMPLPVGCIYGLLLGVFQLGRIASILTGGEKRQRFERIAAQAGGRVLVMRLD